MRDPYHDPEDGVHMEFRLTYSGKLLSSGNDSKGRTVDHKHDLRVHFHPQLKRLWEITPHLKRGGGGGSSALLDESSPDPINYKASWLAKKFHKYNNWHFVPLVTKELELICGIDILFLRPHDPGGILKSGDIDGRLKTLLDALALPDHNQGYGSRSPEKGQNPLYVLLEDDQLITKISVETDQLLDFDAHSKDQNYAKLVITVRLRPYEMSDQNVQFG